MSRGMHGPSFRGAFPPLLAGCALALLSLSPWLARGAERPGAAAKAAYSPLPSPEAEAVLARISAQLGSVRSFEASFAQEHHLALYLDVLKARGVSYFQAPDRFRWEIVEPYRSLLVYDRSRVAKFEERDGKMRYVESGAYDAIRSLMGQMTAWMRGDFRATRDGYALRVLDGRDYEVELTPLSRQMLLYIQRIEVYLRKDPLRVSRIVIREPEKDYIEIRFGDVREDLPLPAGLFDTKTPLAVPRPREAP